MALTAVGFQGTISDVQMATQLGAHHAPTVRSATDLLVTAVNGARTVNVAAGIADSGFVKVTSDGAAAANLALAPPNSGGKWYAITVDRQWSPTSTVTLRADDLAVSDANGTIPTSIPAAALAALAALPNQPGTAGSSAGQRQILAAVYVRAADTTLTLFDLRLVRTGTGVLAVQNLHALAVACATGAVVEGGLVTVRRYPLGAYRHVKSLWQINAFGAAQPDGEIAVDLTTSFADELTAAATFAGGVGPYPNQIQYPTGTMIADAGGRKLRWDGSGWKLWESDWVVFVAGYAGATPSPGSAAVCRMRVRAGLAYFDFVCNFQNTSADAVSINIGPAGVGGRIGGLGSIQAESALAWDGNTARIPVILDWTTNNVGEANIAVYVLQNGNYNRATGQSVPWTWNGKWLLWSMIFEPSGPTPT